MTRNSIASIFLGALIFLSACDSSGDETALDIGVILPLTGTLSVAGTNILRGMELARDEINDSDVLDGTTLNFITEDNTSVVNQSVESYRHLTGTDGVNIILGPYTSSSTAAILDTNPEGVVLLGPTSAASGLSARSTWLFRSSLTVGNLVPGGIMISKQNLRYQDVATIVNDADVFSNSSHDAIVTELMNYTDINVVSSQSFSRTPGDEIGDLTTVLTAIQNENPDAIFLSGLTEDQFGVLIQGYNLGLRNVPYISPLLALADAQDINEEEPGAAEGAVTFHVWLASSENNLSQSFVNSYRARHGDVPDDFAARGYAAVYILTQALINADDYEAASVRTAMAQIQDMETIYGTFSFNSEGDAMYSPLVAQLNNNEFEILE